MEPVQMISNMSFLGVHSSCMAMNYNLLWMVGAPSISDAFSPTELNKK